MTKKKPYADLPAAFLQKLRAVKAKRPKTVIDHILEFGHITTEELRDKYGYDHPPRAVRDVKEHGIPVEMFRVKGSRGRLIAAYRFGDPLETRSRGFAGRKAWSKDFKQKLVETHGERCGICCTGYAARYLQVDHRVPFEVLGDQDDAMDVADYMLVCGSCNRAKSWSCEHCKNWTDDRVVSVCQSCYWANPIDYVHVALRLIRRLDVAWSDSEVAEYDQLLRLSKHARKRLPDFVKEVLRDTLREETEPQ